jgi:hypothetical protein
MRYKIGLWVIGMSIGGMVMVSGCPAVLVGAGAAGTMAYLDGALKSVEPHSFDEVYAATHKVLKDLDMKVVKDTKEKTEAEIAARDEADRKVTIRLVTQYEGITDISIRIGVFGDEKRSRSLYGKIHQALQH